MGREKQGAAGRKEEMKVGSYISDKERLLSFRELMLHPFYVEANFDYEALVGAFEAMVRTD